MIWRRYQIIMNENNYPDFIQTSQDETRDPWIRESLPCEDVLKDRISQRIGNPIELKKMNNFDKRDPSA